MKEVAVAMTVNVGRLLRRLTDLGTTAIARLRFVVCSPMHLLLPRRMSQVKRGTLQGPSSMWTLLKLWLLTLVSHHDAGMPPLCTPNHTALCAHTLSSLTHNLLLHTACVNPPWWSMRMSWPHCLYAHPWSASWAMWITARRRCWTASATLGVLLAKLEASRKTLAPLLVSVCPGVALRVPLT